MSRHSFGTIRKSPSSMRDLIGLPAIQLIVAIEAVIVLSVLALVRS